MTQEPPYDIKELLDYYEKDPIIQLTIRSITRKLLGLPELTVHWLPFYLQMKFLEYTVCLIFGHKKDKQFPGVTEEIYGIKLYHPYDHCLRCFKILRK